MTQTSLTWTRERAEEMDLEDPLAEKRAEFWIPEGTVYLGGNSLGALPAALSGRLQALAGDEWGRGLVASWEGAGWMQAPERVGDKIARLIGAGAGEVIAADSTTVGLTQALLAAVSARRDRPTILTSTTNFPTDLYAATGVAALCPGVALRAVAPDDLPSAIGDDVGVLFLTHVDYRTGAMFDLRGLTAAAHLAGALALWDLCHSAGAVPVGCEENGVDLAVGCGYKYLNGGPGAPGFLYVRRELSKQLANPIRGWLGHAAPFEFSAGWRPAEGIRSFLTSSPPILGLAGLEAGVDVFADVGMADLRSKSMRLGELFVEAVSERSGELELASPRPAEERGSQVSFRHSRAAEIVETLAGSGIVGDFRPPDLCRFGLAPLYLRHVDVFDAAVGLCEAAAALD